MLDLGDFSCPVDIRIADLGCACKVAERLQGPVGTREYQAIEITIGAEWSRPVDISSAACVVNVTLLISAVK